MRHLRLLALALATCSSACSNGLIMGSDPDPDGGPPPPGECQDDPAAPTLPRAFALSCAGCHGANGAGTPGTPSLFDYEADAASFVEVARDGVGTMPAFAEAEVSTPDLEAMHAYFAAGPSNRPTCNGPDVPVPMGCDDEALAVRRLFDAPSASTPISERRPDGVIVTRGAGRVRGRHELEGTFSEFGGRYFENRSYAFEIEDHVAAGEDLVRIRYLPEAQPTTLGPTTNFRYWKVYGDGNVFHRNTDLDEVAPMTWQQDVVGNGRENRPMQVGDVLEFEFGVFIAGNQPGDPGAIEGRTAYYTDTFRYVVGEGRLTSENHDASGVLGPVADARLAGDTTIPWIYAEPQLYFSQMALNMQPDHVQPWLEGRRLFHTDFETGAHSEGDNPVLESSAGMLGPLFNVHRCSECHERNGRSAPPDIGVPLDRVAIKLYGDGPLGNQLQPSEGAVTIARYEEHDVTFADGTVVTLQRPVFAFPADGMRASVRVARQLLGMGLLEAIDEETIVSRADPTDCNGDGISGRVQLATDPRTGETHVGRIGWRAEKISVEHQVADALEADLGVTSEYFPEAGGHFEISAEDLARMTTYMRLLGMPAQRDASDPQVRQGEALFRDLGCVGCHAPTAHTGSTHPFIELRDQDIRPYSDLLLHDLGEDLADTSGGEQGREWRTPPLWGIGLVETVSGHTRLLHDGRARTFLEAILWHGGEAEAVKQRVLMLDAAQRDALVAFLRSL
ncbi:di-heme oxidoredictase family protein [Sandaracinus amylolyticus]|uniref:Putative thiol oxidoreductase n=1 Tax=Sandaracinus amylolyticus TaxID=927083 RepID=A0A0F6W8K6_9BACT|nr:di-heme oxidoredictase family protein [Sandaracinus amylolyticus]AKF10161.1 Putative thiol oxidoreductase [Sandaracinus amylolyticus]